MKSLTATALAAVLAASGARADPYQIVELQALDKVAARVSPLEVPVGKTVTFGSLEIRRRQLRRDHHDTGGLQRRKRRGDGHDEPVTLAERLDEA